MELNVHKKGKVSKLSLLKQQQRSRAGSSSLRCSEDSNSLNLKAEKAVTEALPIVKTALPLQPVSGQRIVTARDTPVSPKGMRKEVKVDLSLKRTVTLSSREDLRELRPWLSNSTSCPGYSSAMDLPRLQPADLADCLVYWKFPFPEISEEQCRRIAATLNGAEGRREAGSAGQEDMKRYFREIAGNWRGAFLSLYGRLKGSSEGDQRHYFYHMQPGFGALFRHAREEGGGGLEALLYGCGEGFRSLLKDEGIAFTEASKPAYEEEEEDMGGAMGDMAVEEGGDGAAEQGTSNDEAEDQENIDPERIRARVDVRLRRGKVAKVRRTQQSSRHVLVVRGQDVHVFVDYLLNQKDGRSTVLIPQLLAPMPFLYGALLRNEALVYGPDATGMFRLRVQGQILPGAAAKIQRILQTHLGVDQLGVAGETDPRTEALTSFGCQYY